MNIQEVIADMEETRHRLLDSSKRANGEPAMNAQALAARSMVYTIDRWITDLKKESK